MGLKHYGLTVGIIFVSLILCCCSRVSVSPQRAPARAPARQTSLSAETNASECQNLSRTVDFEVCLYIAYTLSLLAHTPTRLEVEENQTHSIVRVMFSEVDRPDLFERGEAKILRFKEMVLEVNLSLAKKRQGDSFQYDSFRPTILNFRSVAGK